MASVTYILSPGPISQSCPQSMTPSWDNQFIALEAALSNGLCKDAITAAQVCLIILP